jgi:hypothetical protein
MLSFLSASSSFILLFDNILTCVSANEHVPEVWLDASLESPAKSDWNGEEMLEESPFAPELFSASCSKMSMQIAVHNQTKKKKQKTKNKKNKYEKKKSLIKITNEQTNKQLT